MEDQEIVELFERRSEQAVTELAAKYGKLCKTLSHNILKNEQDAEECVNDAFLAVWNAIPPMRPDSLASYVCKITRNLSLKKYYYNAAEKRNSYYDVALEELEDCFETKDKVEDEVLGKELTKQVNAFLENLKKRDRLIFMQRYWFCYPLPVIAENMGMTVTAVKVCLHRVRERLRKYLNREGYSV